MNLVKHKYETMAESHRGPMLAVHQNTCSVQFQISSKYPETTKILENFVRRHAKQIAQRSTHKRLKDTIGPRKMDMNINNDERVLNKPEIKQLLHLRSKTPSEMTRHETTQESETFQHFSSRGKRNENLKLRVIGSSKNLF